MRPEQRSFHAYLEDMKKTTVKRPNRQSKIHEHRPSSLDETHYYLILAKDLSYADTTSLQSDSEEVARTLTAYLNAIDA